MDRNGETEIERGIQRLRERDGETDGEKQRLRGAYRDGETERWRDTIWHNLIN